jgi:hypothetical protein
MISKNNSIKVKNILNISWTSYGVILIRACVFIVTIFAFSNIALALKWQDKEIEKAVCPETSIEELESEILNFHNEKIINIKDNKIVIIDSQNSEKYFLRNKNSLKIGDKFVELNINTDGQKKEVYLKVWPHLITTRIYYENNTHNC